MMRAWTLAFLLLTGSAQALAQPDGESEHESADAAEGKEEMEVTGEAYSMPDKLMETTVDDDILSRSKQRLREAYDGDESISDEEEEP